MILKFIFAILTRLSFIILSLIAVWQVKHFKENNFFWFLSFLCLPLVVEMIITLKRRKGQDYKWFSPVILLFLITIIPSIWILELHNQQNKKPDDQCAKLDSLENITEMIYSSETTAIHILKLATNLLSSVCLDIWILGLHQALLILLILGKWVLPRGGGITRDELSQLLLIFVGLAADILEFITETLSDVHEKSTKVVYVILAVWTWSMLQFPLHLAVVTSRPEESPKAGSDSLLSRRSTDMWSIVESLFIQDGPFLVVRLTVLIYYKIFHQMLVFFAIKNFLVLAGHPAILLFLITIVPSIWILELHHQQNRNKEPQCMKFHSWEDVKNMINSNGSHHNQSGGRVESSVCPDDWILGLHQTLLILLILGKWLLPLGGAITRDELSQLLLIFVGTAADILEFSTETLSDVKENSPELVYIILAVWSWSMLQFPPHLAVVSPEESAADASDSLLSRRSTDMWIIMESLFIQDGPFLVVRLLVLMHYQLFHLMLLFFAFKNFLVVILNLYRLGVICHDYRKGSKRDFY